MSELYRTFASRFATFPEAEAYFAVPKCYTECGINYRSTDDDPV